MSAILSYREAGQLQEVVCKTAITIGRDVHNDIPVDDLSVSRSHAMIRMIGHDDYYLIDSGSANGSFLNSNRISMPTLLKNGDQIKIGCLEVRFEQENKSLSGNDTQSMLETVISDTPEISEITILVADIRGFSTLSERINIRVLTKMMNAWFSLVSEVILKNGGMVDKFIGDCVFARWQAIADDTQTIYKVLNAAVEINKITEKISQDFSDVTEEIKIGVGINTGAASISAGQDNSAIGDAVNLAFRLESATKVIGKDLVMSECAYRDLPLKYWNTAELHIRVKGKRDPIRIVGLDFAEVEVIVNEN